MHFEGIFKGACLGLTAVGPLVVRIGVVLVAGVVVLVGGKQ